MDTQVKKRNLDEISFIRPLLILDLIFLHAFAPWGGGWAETANFEASEIYFWIDQFAASFMLPTFVFMSGYVWAYQREELGRIESFFELFKKKFTRLYLPCLLFSILYIALLQPANLTSTGILRIFIGVGHLWFLAMLFACFLIYHILLRLGGVNYTTPIIVLLFMIIPVGRPQSFFFIVFFHLGYLTFTIFKKHSNLLSLKNVIFSWFVFGAFFVLITYAARYIRLNYTEAIPHVFHYTYYPSFLVTGILGIWTLILTSKYFTQKRQLNTKYVQLGSLCFGVYIFQEFILQWFYYHTNLVYNIPNILLPWIAVISTLAISTLITYILRLTKLGKMIL